MERKALGGLIAATLEEAEEGPKRADQVVKHALRAHRSLNNTERALLARAVHGARCWARKVRFILHDKRASGAQQVAAWSALTNALSAAEAAALWPEAQAAWACANNHRWRERLPSDPVTRLAIEVSVPDWLAERLVTQRGLAAARALVEAMNEPGPMWLRTNLMKSTASELSAALSREGMTAREGPLPGSILIQGRMNVRGHPAWQTGVFEVQDLGSQLIAAAVGACPGECVADVCAGRGGKSLALASGMRGEGQLLAFDINDDALRALGHRALRAGIDVEIHRGPNLHTALAHMEGRCDRVLVDAPCSALGTLRRGPDLRWRVEVTDVTDFVSTQERILRHAARLVRPGGRLVYATCSVLEEENEQVADKFEAHMPAFRPTRLWDSSCWPQAPERLATATRAGLVPHVDQTDGFFIAAWTRKP